MTDKQRQIEQLTDRRRDWTPIAVVLNSDIADRSLLVDLARENRWQLIHLNIFKRKTPSIVQPRGAIMEAMPDSEPVHALLNNGAPVVRIGRWPHPDDERVPAVMPDIVAGARMAAEHFVERGFSDVAFLGRIPWSSNLEAYEAFAARAAELDCACHLGRIDFTKLHREVPPDQDVWTFRSQVVIEWMQSLPRPVGLLAGGVMDAHRFCHWAIEAGLRVPEDVAIMSLHEDAFMCDSAPIPLSAVADDTERIIETAVSMLRQLLAGRSPEETSARVPPLGVVTRQSTDVLAASDPVVVAALRFMWDHVAEPLTVEQIITHLNVSRRTLERAFKRELGRGINQELQRRRLEKAREMLITTDLSIRELADGLNFSSQGYFGHAFRNAFGLSPAQYRRENQRAD